MARLIVTAAASPILSNFILLVSVSSADGKPTENLKRGSFKVHHLASLNHAGPHEREVTEASEGPDGFYKLSLEPSEVQRSLPPGHYVFAVAVRSVPPRGGEPAHGQTVAVGDIPE